MEDLDYLRLLFPQGSFVNVMKVRPGKGESTAMFVKVLAVDPAITGDGKQITGMLPYVRDVTEQVANVLGRDFYKDGSMRVTYASDVAPDLGDKLYPGVDLTFGGRHALNYYEV
jgi:hypothetical protein